MKARIKNRWAIALVPIAASIADGTAYAAGNQNFDAYQAEFLSEWQADYDRIIEAHPEDPAIEVFQRRLGLTDRIADQLIDSFESSRNSAFGGLLEDIVDLPAGNKEPDVRAGPLSAFEMLMKYRDEFSSGLTLPDLPDTDLDVLRKYYSASVMGATRYIGDHGRMVAAIDETAAAEVAALCVVVPLLHYPDPQWSGAQMEMLPDWVREPRSAKYLEDLALRLRRPNTAFAFAQSGAAEADSGDGVDMTAYLASAAERMVEVREFHAAIHCYRTAADLATSDGAVEQAVDLRLKLARLFSDIDHPALAAEQMGQSMAVAVSPQSYGKASMLRLKYLYEAENFDEIIDESGTYQADERCEPYLPQIIYIAWVVHRRLDQMVEAGKLQSMFFERFPENPLGADMYFASAMNELAASNYAESLRLLEIVEFRYPDSNLIGRVKSIQERLQNSQ